MKTLKSIGRKALIVVLAAATAFLIGYCAVIGQLWISIITLGGIGLTIGANETTKQTR